MKLLILANNSKWATWDKKIKELTDWFAPRVSFDVTILHSAYENIPLVNYGMPGYEGIDPKWYDTWVSPIGRNYDIILFVLPLSQWKLTNGARGWRSDRSYGAVELQVACDENETTSVGGQLLGSTFFVFGRHEILHALFMITGQQDTTHYWWDQNKLENCLTELSIKPNTTDRPTFLQSLFSMPTINKKPSIIKFCEAIKEHEGYFPGSRSYRNNNPGNLKFLGQLASSGPDKDGFCMFKKYDDGFDCLYQMIERAATGKSKIYSPDMDFYTFFRTYAPSSDHNLPDVYAEAVAKFVGVSPWMKLRYL